LRRDDHKQEIAQATAWKQHLGIAMRVGFSVRGILAGAADRRLEVPSISRRQGQQ
jgi:hypothetical protein